MIFRVAILVLLVSTLDCPLPPPVTGGVCLATRVRYRQSCGLDTWSALLAYLFVSRICVAGLCFLFFCFFCSCFIFSPPLRSDRGRFSRLLFFSSLSLLLFVFLDVAMVWKGKPASVTTGSRDNNNNNNNNNNNKPMDLIITILAVVTKDLPISPRFSTLTIRQPIVVFYLLAFPRFPLRKK